MIPNQKAFIEYLEANDTSYTEMNDTTLAVSLGGEYASTVTVVIDFDDDDDIGRTVHFAVANLAHFPDEKLASGLVLCNLLNAKYRWCKFYIDSDNDFIVDSDAILDSDTAGEECYEVMMRIAGISDDCYPGIMKVLYSD